MRAVLGVIAGYFVWTAIWLGGNAAFFGAMAETAKAGQAITSAGTLLGVLALSVVCSLASGAVAAAIAKEKARGAARVLAGLLLATGLAVQAGAWSSMPIWYHLSFWALIVPATLAGAHLIAKRSGPAS